MAQSSSRHGAARQWELVSPRDRPRRLNRRASNQSIGSLDDLMSPSQKQHHRQGSIASAGSQGDHEWPKIHRRQSSGGGLETKNVAETKPQHRRNRSVSLHPTAADHGAGHTENESTPSDSVNREDANKSNADRMLIEIESNAESNSNQAQDTADMNQNKKDPQETKQQSKLENHAADSLSNTGNAHHRRGSSAGSNLSAGSSDAPGHQRGSSAQLHAADLEMQDCDEDKFDDIQETNTFMTHLHRHIFRATLDLVCVRAWLGYVGVRERGGRGCVGMFACVPVFLIVQLLM